jgi:hypothetical protein
MKKLLVYIVAALLVFIPVVTYAVEQIDLANYETMNFKETLESENMTLSDANYTETDDQITIYLFRGNGCGYCRAFLTFLNGITKEYGKYFKVVSFETWYNSDNADLLVAMGDFLEQPAEGAPYIIIGNQVFPGYAASYDQGIKDAITSLYNTKKDDRYDVFKAYNDSLLEKAKAERSATLKPIIWNFIFVTLATIIIVRHTNASNNEFLEEIHSQHRVVEKAHKDVEKEHKPRRK